MTAGRRALLIALAAAVLVIVGLLIALIAASGGNSGGSHNPTPQTSKPADPRAAARAQIERVAEAWRKALSPKSPDNPCRYMTPEASNPLRSLADPRVGARGCAAVVRDRATRCLRSALPGAPFGSAEHSFPAASRRCDGHSAGCRSPVAG